MSLINPTLGTPGDKRGPEELDDRNALSALLAEFNGNIDNANIKGSAGISWSKMQGGLGFLAEVGSNADGAVRRGMVAIPGEDTTSNAAYTLLATPDQVASVAVPAKGYLKVKYFAAYKVSAAATVAAAIFLNSAQVGMVNVADLDVVDTASAEMSTAVGAGNVNKYAAVQSRTVVGGGGGLVNVTGAPADAAFTAFPTSGMVVSPAEIFVAAGTYTVSIRFKTSAGTLSVKDRRLWVETVGF
jgi:hypothetical protein